MVDSQNVIDKHSFEELKKEVANLSEILKTLPDDKKRVMLATLRGMVLALES